MSPSRSGRTTPPGDSATSRSSPQLEPGAAASSGVQPPAADSPEAGENGPGTAGSDESSRAGSPSSGSVDDRQPLEIRLLSPDPGARPVAGDTLELRLQARRDGQPVVGVRIVALGARTARGSGESQQGSVTGPDGEVRLQLLAPTRAGQFPIQLAAEAQPADTLELVLGIAAGPPARVLATPRTLRLQGQVGELPLRFLLLDEHGNPVSHARARAVLGDALIVRNGVTDAQGRVRFSFPKRRLKPGMTVSLRVGGRELVSVPVRR